MKREPLLIDLIIANRVRCPLGPSDAKTFMSVAKDAKRYVFDESAVVALAEVINLDPMIQMDIMDFALPTYPHMWVEMPFPPFWEALVRQKTDQDCEQRIGYLITNGTVYTVMLNSTGKRLEFHQFVYELFKPFPVVDGTVEGMKGYYEAQGGMGPEHVVALMYGGRLDTEKLTTTRSMYLQMLMLSHRVRWSIPGQQFTLNHLSQDSPLRNILGILTLLNRTQDVTYRRNTLVPAVRAPARTKVGMYNGHTVISFKCNPKPMVKELFNTPGVNGRPLHEVAAHYCLNAKAREAEATAVCDHQDPNRSDLRPTVWKEWPDGRREPRQWLCARCSGLKWRREYHLRGDPKHGIQTSEYAVTN